jgi:hypothetical protein
VVGDALWEVADSVNPLTMGGSLVSAMHSVKQVACAAKGYKKEKRVLCESVAWFTFCLCPFRLPLTYM